MAAQWFGTVLVDLAEIVWVRDDAANGAGGLLIGFRGGSVLDVLDSYAVSFLREAIVGMYPFPLDVGLVGGLTDEGPPIPIG